MPEPLSVNSPLSAVVIVAHAPLASALRAVALHVWPDCGDAVLAIDVPATEAPEATLERAQAALANAGRAALAPTSAEKGVFDTRGFGAGGHLQPFAPRPTLILCDLKGATPANVAHRLCGWLNAQSCQQSQPCVAHWLCGVNVPMLLRAMSYAPQSGPCSESAAREWAARAMEGAGRGLEHQAVCHEA